MDVLNKLCSTVSSTVSQLSSVLPGNPVTREFEATCHIASAGPGLLWKIYQGYKKSTKQEAAIFVFEKRQLERWPRGDREAMLETLRRGVSQLTRLRHPQILIVQHPLEESRESLAFATEPVFASLANILGSTENMPSPPPTHLRNYKLFEVEIKYGLLQVGEGLAFLHSDVKLLHHNICPEVIVVNQQGAWKIFGFDFCIHNHNTQDSQPYWPFVEYSPTLHPVAQPSLDYLAPEHALTLSHSPASDMFSLGMLILALHNSGQPLNNNNGDWSSYKRNACELKQLPASRLLCVTDGLREFVRMMLNVTPELRPDAHQFTKIEFFEDVGVKTLNYLDSLFQWDNLQKSQFYKGLPQIIQNLPHRVCIYRILPCLMKEFVNPTMVPFVLPNVLLVAENCSKEEYSQHILPHLKPVMKMQDPIQILLIFMQKMELLLKLTPAEEIKTDVLPMLYRALESDAQQIQELCLSVLPTFAGLIDYPAMKNALLPRIKRLCIATSYISVRVNCLVCVGKLLEHLDKWLVLDEVLPFLPQIPSREPAVLMGILGIYKLALTHKKLGITKELMATKILPFLMPLSIENGLTLNQFNALMTVIKEMVSRVEGEHRTKLEQLNSIQQESKSVSINLSTNNNPSQLVPAPQPQSELDQMFSGLGLDSFIGGNEKNETSKTPQVNGNINSSTSLSLQDKQRLVMQQETQQRLQAQPVLTPSAPAQSKAQTSVKDLTATLVESNLNQIKYTRPHIQTGDQVGGTGWQNAVRPGASPQGFGAFQTAPVGAQWQWHSPPPSFMPPQQSVFTSPHQKSSLDSLLPTADKLPMNRMQAPMQQPLITVSPFQQPQQQQTKALSSSEINDFLS
ncbi:SCY1-like protein 2 [Cryptotermes secundus]|uniref:SCY1-like protein 2 n=1 Tax=Cryptotermes secundus TaxID=105785 RepID=A0A2J7RM58_9NEOP|nr:SCY1-like protein 2 isoform X2 [Cryptotermes secundus]PNF41917.1 SCY1-like protein 2 [Cryptotermes secundus]